MNEALRHQQSAGHTVGGTGEVEAHCATLGAPAPPPPTSFPSTTQERDDILYGETRERGDPAAHTGLGPHTQRAQDAILGESDPGTLSGRRVGRFPGAGLGGGGGEEFNPWQ